MLFDGKIVTEHYWQVPGLEGSNYANIGIAAVGGLGRRVYVAPSMMLVVTRLGDSPEPGFDDEFCRLLIAAAIEDEAY